MVTCYLGSHVVWDGRAYRSHGMRHDALGWKYCLVGLVMFHMVRKRCGIMLRRCGANPLMWCLRLGVFLFLNFLKSSSVMHHWGFDHKQKSKDRPYAFLRIIISLLSTKPPNFETSLSGIINVSQKLWYLTTMGGNIGLPSSQTVYSYRRWGIVALHALVDAKDDHQKQNCDEDSNQNPKPNRQPCVYIYKLSRVGIHKGTHTRKHTSYWFMAILFISLIDCWLSSFLLPLNSDFRTQKIFAHFARRYFSTGAFYAAVIISLSQNEPFQRF